jgi:ABC-type transporter Mla subunit MlaD
MTPRTVLAALLATVVALVVLIADVSGGGRGPYEVRAIFDNAGFAVSGEDVRIAGANVGSIQSLGVTQNHEAAVTLAIDRPGFTPFHANATCTIRPQSLIAERYVDCLPGSASAPALQKLTSGAYLLPVTRTHSPIDTDVVQDISQAPLRERLSVILDELGTGLAARGSDLNAVIHRADPALGYTDSVLKILDRQDRVLARLATDSEAVLAPLARARGKLADFVIQANTTAVASAARAAAISRTFQLLPGFLSQLRPLMTDLGALADQGTPLLGDLGRSAAAIDRQFKVLVPFAQRARPALIALGNAAQRSEPDLLASTPLANRLVALGTQAVPAAGYLDRLLGSLNTTGAIEQLMGVLFNGTSAANGFDADGHYVRIEGLVGDCTAYALSPVGGCSAKFGGATAVQSDRAAQTLKGLLGYLVGHHR